MTFIDPELLAELLADQGTIPEMSDRDFAGLLVPHLDYEAQLAAIKEMLQRHRETEAETAAEIRRIEAYLQQTRARDVERAEDERAERLEASVYQDAAHSTAAIGMLAPFVESLFYQTFLKLRECSLPGGVPSHPRFQQSVSKAWDCHYVWSNGQLRKNGIVKGIRELSDAVGLTPHLPERLWQMLDALFSYRNSMLHNGFEWVPTERERFARRTSNWPRAWFSLATSDGKPWVFYMTETLISEVLDLIDHVLVGLGAFARGIRC